MAPGFTAFLRRRTRRTSVARKLAEEVARKRGSAAEAPDGHDALGRQQALQQQTATPYLVLSGKVCIVIGQGSR